MGYNAYGNGTFVLRLKDDDVFDGAGATLLNEKEALEVICDHFEETDIHKTDKEAGDISPFRTWEAGFGGKYFGDLSVMLANLGDSLVEFWGEFKGEDDYAWRTVTTPEGDIKGYDGVMLFPEDPSAESTQALAELVKIHASSRGVSIEDALADLGTTLGATVSPL